MVFIRFQYPLQRHFVVLVVAGLVVDITIMQAPIAIHRFMFIPMVLQDLSVGLLQVPNKQWGFEETETKTIAFPISFESIKYVFLSKIYGPASGGADTVAYNFFRKSLTGVSFDYAYTRNWLAIGGQQQQWGYGNSESTQTFPIKFTNSVIGIYGSKRAINYEYTFAATSITNTNFFMSTRNSEGNSRVIACNWLAIGQQQTK